MEILIKRLDKETALPAYGREIGPGINLCAAKEVRVEPGARVMVPTGVAVALPVGYVGNIINEYSSMVESAVRVTTGTVDSGYRHEIVVEVTNSSEVPHTFLPGAKVAQMLVQKVEHAQMIEAEDLGAEGA
jgi:dUTP pyrophosphatase